MKGRFSGSCQPGAGRGTTVGPTPSRAPQAGRRAASPARLFLSPLQSRRDPRTSRAPLLILWAKAGKENCPQPGTLRGKRSLRALPAVITGAGRGVAAGERANRLQLPPSCLRDRFSSAASPRWGCAANPPARYNLSPRSGAGDLSC